MIERIKSVKLDKKQVFDCLFLLYYGVVFTRFFLDTTMLPYITWNIEVLYIIGITIGALKLAVDLRMKTWELIVFGLTITVAMLQYYHRPDEYVLAFAVLFIGAYNVDYRKMLKVYLGLGISYTVFVVIGCLLGYIENLTFTLWNGNVRNSFGFNYPTDFTAHLFFFIAVWCILRYEKITWIEIGVFAAVMLWSYFGCYARNNTICIGLVIMLCILEKVLPSEKKFALRENKVLKAVCVMIPFLIIGGMIFLSLIYNDGNAILSKLNDVFNSRFQLGKYGFVEYGLSPWGKLIEMQGFGRIEGGMENLWNTGLSYFVLDCSYVNILLQFGVVLFCVLVILQFVEMVRNYQADCLFLLMIYIVICIQCAVEHHYLEIAYNPLLFFSMIKYGKFNNK